MNLPSNRRNSLFLLAFFLILQVAACTTLPREGPAEGGFHLRGKMGVVQGGDSFSANFLWRQDGSRFTMDLWGPLGQGRLQLTGNGRRLELREGDGSLISRGPPDAVMYEHLGWSLPLSVLPQWVRGHPATNLPATFEVRDEAGRITAFQQLDWQVELDRYRRVAGDTGAMGADTETLAGSGLYLPHRVTARRGEYRVRLAISEWRI